MKKIKFKKISLFRDEAEKQEFMECMTMTAFFGLVSLSVVGIGFLAVVTGFIETIPTE